MQRNTRRNTLWRVVALALSLPLAGGWSVTALAQQAPADTDDSEVRQLETVSVLGSRRVDRSSDTTSPVPVDVIPLAKAAEQGAQFDLAQTLQYTVVRPHCRVPIRIA